MRLPKLTPPATDPDKSDAGLGTLLRRALSRIGVPACSGCESRERVLNDLFPIPPSKGKRKS